MSIDFKGLPDGRTWALLVGAATRALEDAGYSLQRVPGRGRSNVWDIERNGISNRACIRTTRDRWIAFPPLDGGASWKTLDDVELVVVAAVDDVQDPRNVEVYLFDATEVRQRFDESYSARAKGGYTLRDDFGMWVCLDIDDRGIPVSVGSGIAAAHGPVATYPMIDLIASDDTRTVSDAEEDEADDSQVGSAAQPSTIAEVMLWARERIAELSGVNTDSVKIDCRIES